MFFFEPIPKAYEDAEGMYYGIGIGSNIFCGAMCFLHRSDSTHGEQCPT